MFWYEVAARVHVPTKGLVGISGCTRIVVGTKTTQEGNITSAAQPPVFGHLGFWQKMFISGLANAYGCSFGKLVSA